MATEILNLLEENSIVLLFEEVPMSLKYPTEKSIRVRFRNDWVKGSKYMIFGNGLDTDSTIEDLCLELEGRVLCHRVDGEIKEIPCKDLKHTIKYSDYMEIKKWDITKEDLAKGFKLCIGIFTNVPYTEVTNEMMFSYVKRVRELEQEGWPLNGIQTHKK